VPGQTSRKTNGMAAEGVWGGRRIKRGELMKEGQGEERVAQKYTKQGKKSGGWKTWTSNKNKLRRAHADILFEGN